MEKKFFKYLFLGVFVLSLGISFIGCKEDYDDDIENLDQAASIAELFNKVQGLETSVQEAKTEAEAAKAKAEEALAGGGGDSGQAIKDLQAQIAKLASLAAVEEKLAALETKLMGKINDADISKLAAEIEALAAEIMSLIGHRLTSLSVIPTTHINGIPAIRLVALQYTPQKYQARTKHIGGPEAHTSRPVLDHANVSGAGANYISTEHSEAYYHVSPSVGVRTEDIELPSFDCLYSENYVTRGPSIKTNDPVAPVGYEINKNVLTVKFKRTVAAGSLGTKGNAHTDGKENFWMVSLKAPIAPANYTDAETAKGEKVYVNSEYVRIEEASRAPYLVNKRTDFNRNMAGVFADETQADSKGKFYVHFHDSVCVYESKANELITKTEELAYDQPFDLKTLAKVCIGGVNSSHANHEDLVNYKDYGLTFRYYLAKAPYLTLGGPEDNSNKTDQQKFAAIDSPENGLLSSRVYTIDGVSATAVGREPIVRIELVDTVNNALVGMRYMKFKWVKESKRLTPITLDGIFPDTIYYCGNYHGRIGTQVMNEQIYHVAEEGGMTKQKFHLVFADFDGTTGPGQGTVTELVNSEPGVDSYNLLWTLTHKDIVTKYPNWNSQEKMEFTKVCYYKDATGEYEDWAITLKRTIYKPVFGIGAWGIYDGRYWKTSEDEAQKWKIFNVNPIVYDTYIHNPAWNVNADDKENPTCNIYTDLLNGFLTSKGEQILNGAASIVSYKDANDKEQSYLPTYYGDGVRFVFDANRLASDDYIYSYFNGTSMVNKKATVNADGTVLYIDNRVAARIINNRANKRPGSKGEPTYNIVLEEANPAAMPYEGANPTEAAKAIVGKLVPIKMIADICDDSKYAAVIKTYDAFIIEPLTVEVGTTDHFTDAIIGGSTISVKNSFKYKSWNADATGKHYTVAKPGTDLEEALWDYYEVGNATWMTGQIKTNLKMVNGNLEPVADYESGSLPSNTNVLWDSEKQELTYYNYTGTPVNWDYELYIPVEFGYKWKTFTKTFTVKVKKNTGTPAE